MTAERVSRGRGRGVAGQVSASRPSEGGFVAFGALDTQRVAPVDAAAAAARGADDDDGDDGMSGRSAKLVTEAPEAA